MKKTQITVALMFIIAIVLFLWAYGYFTKIGKNTTLIKIKFPTAENISVGSPVTLYGVEIGTVSKIKLSQDGALLSCKVELPFKLRKETEFEIRPKNLMGENKVVIIPNLSNDYITSYDTVFVGKSAVNLASIFKNIQKITENLLPLLSDKNLTEKIYKLSNDISEFVKMLNDPSAKDMINKILSDADKTILEYNRLATQNKDKISDILINGDSSLKKLQKTQDKLDKILSNLSYITLQAKQNDNDLNNFIKDKKLYEHLLRTATKMDSLLDDIKRNPKRYINVKVF